MSKNDNNTPDDQAQEHQQDNQASATNADLEQSLEHVDLEHELDMEHDDAIADAPAKRKGGTGKAVIYLLILGTIGYGLYYFGSYFFAERERNQPISSSQTAENAPASSQEISTNDKTSSSSDNNSSASLQSALSQQLNQEIALIRQENERRFAEMQQQQNSTIGQLQAQLDNANRQLLAFDAAKNNQWAFAEAEYLIRQASQRLAFTSDTKPVIALLQAADQKIASLGKVQYRPLRQAIQNDMTQLQASGSLDLDGVTLSLESLKSQVAKLPLASIQLNKSAQNSAEANTEANTAEPTDDSDTGIWDNVKNSMAQALDKVYTVHHYDESVKPFISPNQDALLRQNMVLQLQAAQLAALSHNQALYRTALNELKTWASEYFQQQSPETQAFIWKLTDLSQRSVALNLPQELSSMGELSLHSPSATAVPSERPQAEQLQSEQSQPEQSTTETVTSIGEVEEPVVSRPVMDTLEEKVLELGARVESTIEQELPTEEQAEQQEEPVQ